MLSVASQHSEGVDCGQEWVLWSEVHSAEEHRMPTVARIECLCVPKVWGQRRGERGPRGGGAGREGI